jgi:general secretion pathway protein G
MNSESKNKGSTAKKILRSQSGFSLIELMIVVAILGLLIGIVGPKVMGSFDKAKVETTRVNMKNLSSTLKQFRLDCGSYPTTEQGIEALITKPTAGAECKNYAPGGYLDKKTVPKDAWDKEYIYTSDGNTFEIKSLGADKVEGGVDYNADISLTDQD